MKITLALLSLWLAVPAFAAQADGQRLGTPQFHLKRGGSRPTSVDRHKKRRQAGLQEPRVKGEERRRQRRPATPPPEGRRGHKVVARPS